MEYEYLPVTWDHPKAPPGPGTPSPIHIPISSEEFVVQWGGRVHASGRFFTREEVRTMDYHHVWTVTDQEAAHVGLVAVPGEFGDAYYGYCVTDHPWAWDFYKAGGYAVVTEGGDDANEKFHDEGVIPLPSSTEFAG